jgi:hypothetical protein
MARRTLHPKTPTRSVSQEHQVIGAITSTRGGAHAPGTPRHADDFCGGLSGAVRCKLGRGY